MHFGASSDSNRLPLDFDWCKFDQVTPQCRDLAVVVVDIVAVQSGVTNIAEDLTMRLKRLREANKLVLKHRLE